MFASPSHSITLLIDIICPSIDFVFVLSVLRFLFFLSLKTTTFTRIVKKDKQTDRQTKKKLKRNKIKNKCTVIIKLFSSTIKGQNEENQYLRTYMCNITLVLLRADGFISNFLFVFRFLSISCSNAMLKSIGAFRTIGTVMQHIHVI